MTIAVVTGGRDRTPTLSEFEALLSVLERRGVTAVREGEARGTDKAIAAYLRARARVTVEPWAADWDRHGKAAGAIRNRAMLDGGPANMPGALLQGEHPRPRADLLIAFRGGRGTADCIAAALERGLPVEWIPDADEPRAWNMHHGQPPEPTIYVGRSPRWGGPHPLANPYPVQVGRGQSRSDVAGPALRAYKRWLWSKIDPESARRDPRVVAALESITPAHHLGCTCWPHHCHAEIVIAAWRWMQRNNPTLARSSGDETIGVADQQGET